MGAVSIIKYTSCASVLVVILWRNQVFLTQEIPLVKKKDQRNMQEEKKKKIFADVTSGIVTDMFRRYHI